MRMRRIRRRMVPSCKNWFPSLVGVFLLRLLVCMPGALYHHIRIVIIDKSRNMYFSNS